MTHQSLISPPWPVDIPDMAHPDNPLRPRSRLPLVGQLLLGAAALISAASAVPAMGARSPAPSSTSSLATSSPDAGSDPATVARHFCYRLLADDTTGTYREMREDEIALRHADQAPDEDWAATYQGCGEGLAAWADEVAR